MASSLKRGAQFALALTTLTDIYACPVGKSVEVSIIVCNRGAATTFRLAIAIAGAADNVKHYLYYDSAIAANASVILQNIQINENDLVRAYGAAATLSVSVFVRVIENLVE